jgi:hypothetical protein
MQTTPRSTRQTFRHLMTALFISLPSTACALNGGTGARLVDLPAENRLQVLVGADSAGDGVVVEGRVGRDLLAFNFRLEAVDADGQATAIPADARLVLRIGGDVAGEVTFSRDFAELTMPRPYAIRVGAEDQIVVGTANEASAGPVTLRLTIDYEPIERARTRMVVRSFRVAQQAQSATAASFEWRQTSNGRMLGIGGLPLSQIGTVVVVDGATGERLWATDLRGARTTAGTALRLSVPVQAGRIYRIDVTLLEARSKPVAESVLAMVLPESR